jgi:P4 family phage/plasmid primase-like protien
VYDLEKNIFRIGYPEDYITLTCGYELQIDLDDSKYIDEILNIFNEIYSQPGVCDYVLDKLAYALHGDKYEDDMICLVGEGRNGKDAAVTLSTMMLGQYAGQPDASLWMGKTKPSNQANSELDQTRGMRLLVSSEPDSNDQFNIALIKKFTGQDLMSARSLYKDSKPMNVQAFMMIQMNLIPYMANYDKAAESRFRNVEHIHDFVLEPQEPHEKKIDTTIKQKFRNMIEYRRGFMKLLLKRYEERIKGNKHINIPDAVKVFTQEYIQENNIVLTFLQDSFIITKNKTDVVTHKTVWNMWKCSSHCVNTMKPGTFKENMKINKFKIDECPNNSNYPENCRRLMCYFGLQEKIYSDTDSYDPLG